MTRRNPTTTPVADTRLTIVRLPLSAVASVHPIAREAAQLADAAYLAKDLSPLTPEAGVMLLSLEPILVVGPSNKLRRIANHRTFAIARQLISDDTPVPVLRMRGRPDDHTIAQIAAYDAIVHRLLTSLDKGAVDQLHRMCEALEPGYKREGPGRPRKDAEAIATPLRGYFRRRLGPDTLHGIAGMAATTKRRRRRKAVEPEQGEGADD